jgi:hypothetical protein
MLRGMPYRWGSPHPSPLQEERILLPAPQPTLHQPPSPREGRDGEGRALDVIELPYTPKMPAATRKNPSDRATASWRTRSAPDSHRARWFQSAHANVSIASYTPRCYPHGIGKGGLDMQLDAMCSWRCLEWNRQRQLYCVRRQGLLAVGYLTVIITVVRLSGEDMLGVANDLLQPTCQHQTKWGTGEGPLSRLKVGLCVFRISSFRGGEVPCILWMWSSLHR